MLNLFCLRLVQRPVLLAVIVLTFASDSSSNGTALRSHWETDADLLATRNNSKHLQNRGVNLSDDCVHNCTQLQHSYTFPRAGIHSTSALTGSRHPERTFPMVETLLTEEPPHESSVNGTIYLDVDVDNWEILHTVSTVNAFTAGVLYLSPNKYYSLNRFPGDWALVRVTLVGKAGHFFTIFVEQLSKTCYEDRHAIKATTPSGTIFYSCSTMSNAFSVNVVQREKTALHISYYNYPQLYISSGLSLPRYKVYFQSSEENFMSQINVTFTSNTTGTITPWWFDNRQIHSCFIETQRKLFVSAGNVIMISAPFVALNIIRKGNCQNYIYLSGDRFPAYRQGVCGSGPMNATVWNSTVGIYLHVNLVQFPNYIRFNKGLKMLFSYHKSSNAFQKENGQFDCSGPDYASFKQHVHCNLEPECAGGEDEGGHCPYSSPICNGSVASGSKCYQFFLVDKKTHLYSAYTPGYEDNNYIYRSPKDRRSWFQAQEDCEQKGGNLAMAKTWSDLKALLQLFQYGKNFGPAWIGLHTGLGPVLNVYKYMLKWVDSSIVLNINTTYSPKVFHRSLLNEYQYGRRFPFVSLCGLAIMSNELLFELGNCFEGLPGYICEFDRGADKQHPPIFYTGIKLKARPPKKTNLSLVTCRDGHLTHLLLACDPVSDCETQEAICPTVSSYSFATDVYSPLYTCDDKTSAIPYTLVCDFKHDCQDGSDEAFCHHDRQCSGFTCTNGQCVDANKNCEGVLDCWDGSDEECGALHLQWLRLPRMVVFSPHMILNYDTKGRPSMTPIDASIPCPETHFRCFKGYCLPVYLRCNGVLDCPGREDEADCQSFTCPGFYRCRASSVCVNIQHLCDGLPQCPQHDDELLCQATCPEGCSCQGLSFVCPHHFSADSFPDVRYLDASGSGMTPNGVSKNMYLVWLRMSSCQLRHIQTMTFPNLRILDLSHNNLSSVSMEVFLSLPNLRTLSLSGNPLVVVNGPSSSQYGNLTALDLSGTKLRYFDSRGLAPFPKLQWLNMSFTGMAAIAKSGFTYTRGLVGLDLRGNPVREFPVGLMVHLTHLSVVYASNYRLCCEDNLPGNIHSDQCVAPADPLSGCGDLVNSETLRVTLWLLSLSSLVGNGGWVVFRVLTGCAVTSPFNILLTNLGVSDFLMGLYLVLVGGADLVYRGHYSSFYTQWTSSLTCTTAGFLCGLSNQVSAFVIGLIALDRFLAVSCPIRRMHFTRRSAAIACGVTWVVGTVTASTALLSMRSHWQADNIASACNPLHVTRKSLRSQKLFFGMAILLNWLLSLLMSAGQAAVYWTLYSGFRTLEISESPDVSLARRMTTIVTSNLLYWTVMVIVYLADLTGSSVSGVMRVMVIMVLFPLNSALNPFLYLLRLRKERDRLVQREKLFRRLTQRLKRRRSVPDGRSNQHYLSN